MFCIVTSDDPALLAHPCLMNILISTKVDGFRVDKPVNLIHKDNLN